MDDMRIAGDTAWTKTVYDISKKKGCCILMQQPFYFRLPVETGEFTPASFFRIPFHNRRFRSLRNGLHG